LKVAEARKPVTIMEKKDEQKFWEIDVKNTDCCSRREKGEEEKAFNAVVYKKKTIIS
jgi:hypothetical protein